MDKVPAIFFFLPKQHLREGQEQMAREREARTVFLSRKVEPAEGREKEARTCLSEP